MTKEKWKEVLAAKEILGLEDTVTMTELKKTYRRLSKQFHPDTAASSDRENTNEKFREISKAYSVIRAYCEHYPVTFNPEEDGSMSAEDFWMDRFGQDPLWGKGT